MTSPPAGEVRLERDGDVATLLLDAPGRGNSLDQAMLARLEALLRGLDPTVRVLLLRGAGEKAFSTGYHVPSLLAELAQGPSVSDFESHPLERALRALEACPIPTIAVVWGNAYGAGCELALACDLRLAAADARLCMPPAKLGVLYSATGMRRLLELVGPAVAKELLFTAEPVDAVRALSVGLVNRVVAPDALLALATEMAGTIARNAALSIRHTKTIFRRFLTPPALSPEALAEVAKLRDECFRSAEFLERSKALGKRG